MNTTNAATHEQVLIVGKGFSIEGQVHGQGTLVIRGCIQGQVEADTVQLSEGAQVTGHIQCRQLDVAGRLDGSFQSTDVVVRAAGVVIANAQAVSTGTCLVAGAVSGPLQAQKLKVEATGQLSGKIRAAQMDVHGHVQGEVDADDIVVRSSGTVDGRVHYGNISMERGSDVSGQIQRKDRRATATAADADDKVVIHLPVNIVQQLRKQADDLQLSLANGDPLPSWITVDREHAWLVLDKSEFNRLSAQQEVLSVRLQAGPETLVFKLPPEAA